MNNEPMKKSNQDKPINENLVIKKLSLVSVVGNVVLSVFKLFAGIFGNSGAMVSDAVHSLSDVLTTAAAFIGVKLSQRAADKEHPYGHERIECVASLFLGLILLFTGLGIGETGVKTIFSGNYSELTSPKFIALIAAVFSILVKEGMYWYTRYYAKLIHSQAFLADAWHHRSDAFSSVGALIGIGGAMLGFPIMDSIASVIICIFILKVSYDILKNAVSNMMDTSCGEEYENRLVEFVKQNHEVEKVDVIHTRSFGNKVYVDMEITIDAEKSFQEAHEVCEEVHAGVEQNFPEIKHIMIHANPSASNEEKIGCTQQENEV